MSLKFTSGKVGQIKYLGNIVTIWKYIDGNALHAEIEQLGRYLDDKSMAWVGQEFLVYRDKIVGKTTPNGSITWLDRPMDLPEQFRLKKNQQQIQTMETSKGKRREASVIDDAADIDMRTLWQMATRTDWEDIMVKTSW